MGSDARLYVFDVGRFRGEVVPSLLELLLTGRPDAHLRQLLPAGTGVESFQALLDHLTDHPLDFASACTYLGPDLRWLGTVTAEDAWAAPWQSRACPSTSCPVRAACPLHELHNEQRHTGAASNLLAEGLCGLFEAAVRRTCLGPSQFLGRSVHAHWYQQTLTRLGVTASDPLTSLVDALALRGFVIGYGFSNGDGIHGWLDEGETAELAERLGALPLPVYQASFEAMQTFQQLGHVTPDGGTRWRQPGIPFEELSLTFVRTVATIAAQDGKGVLWGNDISEWE